MLTADPIIWLFVRFTHDNFRWVDIRTSEHQSRKEEIISSVNKI